MIEILNDMLGMIEKTQTIQRSTNRCLLALIEVLLRKGIITDHDVEYITHESEVEE